MLTFSKTTDGFHLSVKVTPKASRTAIEMYRDGDTSLRIKVTTVPEDGKANDAVIALLSKILKLSKRFIVLESGATGREKVFRIVCDTPEPLLKRLSSLVECPVSLI